MDEITTAPLPTDEAQTRAPDEILLDKFAAALPKLSPEELSHSYHEMCEAHPEVDLASLATDPLFSAFAVNRNADIRSVFEDYTAFTKLAEESIGEKIRRRDFRATGSGDARTSAADSGLSAAQTAFLREWNAEHPEYAMSAREYAASL